ncbi:MAG: flagellar protein FliS [Actinomycetota bacterium]|nr:MAG: flagellar protein FliS [Actinomycetota bacterium]
MTSNAYLKSAIETATPEQLILALYDGGLAAVERAREALAAGGSHDREVAHRELVRAQSIVLELRLALDLERGGEIARSLASLYAFCFERLLEANLRKDPAGLEAVARTFSELRDAWAQAVVHGRQAAAQAG